MRSPALILSAVLALMASNPAWSGPPVSEGFYHNADGSPVLPMIDGAKSSIDIEIYTMYDLAVRNALRRAMDRKVRVRIIQEPAADSCKPFTPVASGDKADCVDTKKLVKEVNSAGGAYLPYNKQALCADPAKACYQHGKLLIADGAAALISTGNFDATGLCDMAQRPSRCNRDYTFVTRDSEVLDALGRIFTKDLAGKSYDLSQIVTGTVAKKLTVSPLSLQPLISFIQSAKASIELENQYLEQRDLNAALQAASRKGVKVEVTVASLCAFGKPSTSDAQRATAIYSDFDSAGVSSAMFTNKITVNNNPGYLHAKAIVVDGKRAWVGSVNGSNAATTNNREFGIYFDNPAWVSALREQIQSDHDSRGSESWKDSLDCRLDN